jgi:hypothetical protein
MKDIFLDFLYFKAPLSHSLLYPGAEPDTKECFYCKKHSEHAFYSSDSDDNNPIYGCLECFQQKRFSIDHETEIGNIEKGRIVEIECSDYIDIEKAPNASEDEMLDYLQDVRIEKRELPVPDGFNKNALVEIGFCPPIATFQRSIYLCHCNDFMIYIGRWSPKDFEANSPDGDGRKLWMKMIEDERLVGFWDCSIKEMEEDGVDWRQSDDSKWCSDALVYVFRCLHCNTLRCYYDCD